MSSRPDLFVGEFKKIRLVRGRILITDEDRPGPVKIGSLYVPHIPGGLSDPKLVVATVLQLAETSLDWSSKRKPPYSRPSRPFLVKVGDKVLIDRRIGERITVAGRPCRIVTENQILAVVEESG